MDAYLANHVWVAVSILLVAWLFLYVARKSVHRAFRTCGRLLRRPLRLWARFILSGAQDLHRRNRVVLAAQARLETEERLDREFARINEIVRRDIQGFPAIQARLLENITRIEADYQQSAELPMPSSDWVKAVGSIMRIKAPPDPTLEKILLGLRALAEQAQEATLREYRAACQKRHTVLARGRLVWRSVDDALHCVDGRLADLTERALIVDNTMARYEALAGSRTGIDDLLHASALVRFVVGAFVLMIAAAGALLNFHLIATPLDQVLQLDLPGGRAGVRLAAGIVIGIEMLSGLFCLDAWRVTHLFPQVGRLGKRGRSRIVGGALGILMVMIVFEATLAFVHQDASGQLSTRFIGMGRSWPMIGRAMLGLVLPGILAFVALPLEAFLFASRDIIGALLVEGLRVLAFILRMCSQAVAALVVVFTFLYDLVISPVLLLEKAFYYVQAGSATARSRHSR